jgi:hypothetical protein
MHRLTRLLAVALLGTSMALAAPVSAGDLSVSIVGDGYIVNPGPNAAVIYYGPQQFVAPPVYPGYGYGYGYPPPGVYQPYGYYGAPGYAPYPYGYAYGRRGLRLY